MGCCSRVLPEAWMFQSLMLKRRSCTHDLVVFPCSCFSFMLYVDVALHPILRLRPISFPRLGLGIRPVSTTRLYGSRLIKSATSSPTASFASNSFIMLPDPGTSFMLANNPGRYATICTRFGSAAASEHACLSQSPMSSVRIFAP